MVEEEEEEEKAIAIGIADAAATAAVVVATDRRIDTIASFLQLLLFFLSFHISQKSQLPFNFFIFFKDHNKSVDIDTSRSQKQFVFL